MNCLPGFCQPLEQILKPEKGFVGTSDLEPSQTEVVGKRRPMTCKWCVKQAGVGAALRNWTFNVWDPSPLRFGSGLNYGAPSWSQRIGWCAKKSTRCQKRSLFRNSASIEGKQKRAFSLDNRTSKCNCYSYKK